MILSKNRAVRMYNKFRNHFLSPFRLYNPPVTGSHVITYAYGNFRRPQRFHIFSIFLEVSFFLEFIRQLLGYQRHGLGVRLIEGAFSGAHILIYDWLIFGVNDWP